MNQPTKRNMKITKNDVFTFFLAKHDKIERKMDGAWQILHDSKTTCYIASISSEHKTIKIC